jgi:hypothetical protein
MIPSESQSAGLVQQTAGLGFEQPAIAATNATLNNQPLRILSECRMHRGIVNGRKSSFTPVVSGVSANGCGLFRFARPRGGVQDRSARVRDERDEHGAREDVGGPMRSYRDARATDER